MSAYAGVFALTMGIPVWAIVFFALIIGIGIPFVIADRASGLFFNFSYSGMVGDICLLTVVLVGIAVIQRGASLPAWLANGTTQAIWLVLCIVVGILLVTISTPWPTATWPDRYHNCVVVPLFLFFTPLAVLATLYNGNRVEVVVSLLLIATWGGLVVYDFRDGRINQPGRLERLFDIKLVNGRFEKI